MRTAELITLVGVLDDLFHSAFAEPQCLSGDTDTAAVEGSHSDVEALALPAQQRFSLGYDAVSP